jgi:HPr kinase/phosphorylase
VTTPAASHQEILHATCVAFAKRGVLILGPSGSGKSALGLQLMALGARLVADDRTVLTAKAGLTPKASALVATSPPTIRGLIEARGLGLIRADAIASAPVVLVVDLGHTETDRLPPFRRITLCGIDLALVLGQQSPHFPSSLLAYMNGGRQA